VIARVGVPNVDQVCFSFAGAPEAFLRIIPMRRDRPIPIASLKEVAGSAELLRSAGFGGSTCVNKYGAVLYSSDGSYRGGRAPLHWATQLFQNGELWSVTDSIIVRRHNGRPAWWPMPLIPATVLEKTFYKTLHKNGVFAVEHLGLTFPCTIELGIVGLSDAHLAINESDIRGPIQLDDAIVRKELMSADRAAINAVLLEFFNEVYDKTGYPRPVGLHGFPPGEPHANKL
jgi:hypothetical protein